MEKRHQPRSSAVVVIIIGILAVSSASIFIRFAQKDVPSIIIAAYRLTLASLLMLPFCLRGFLREILPASRKNKGLIVLSGVFLAFHFYFWITSLAYTSVTSSVVLVATSPLWVAILSPLFLKERIGRWTGVGLVIAMIGSIIVGLGSGCTLGVGGLNCASGLFQTRDFLGDLMALAGAFFSCGYLIIGRKVQEEVSFTSYVFPVYSVAAIVLLVMAVFSGERFTGYTGIDYLWLAALALIPQLIGHSSFNWALKYLPAAFVAITLLGEPIGTVILTMIFLKESPSALEIFGGVMILAGIVVASRLQKTGADGLVPTVE